MVQGEQIKMLLNTMKIKRNSSFFSWSRCVAIYVLIINRKNNDSNRKNNGKKDLKASSVNREHNLGFFKQALKMSMRV